MSKVQEAAGTSNATAVKRAAFSLVIFAALTGLLFWFVPIDYQLWIKALHIIAVIAWMAGMLYLPRLFVYHCSAEPGSATSETFKVMERRLLRAIINPAMIAVWVFGLWLAWRVYEFSEGWLLTKIGLAIVMSTVHGYFSYAVRLFAEDRNTRSALHWRVMNEVPTLIMMAIVVLAVVRPF